MLKFKIRAVQTYNKFLYLNLKRGHFNFGLTALIKYEHAVLLYN